MYTTHGIFTRTWVGGLLLDLLAGAATQCAVVGAVTVVRLQLLRAQQQVRVDATSGHLLARHRDDVIGLGFCETCGWQQTVERLPDKREAFSKWPLAIAYQTLSGAAFACTVHHT